LADCDAIERELRTLTPVEDRSKELDKLAKFLANVVDAWDEATQEQRTSWAAGSGYNGIAEAPVAAPGLLPNVLP